MCARLSYGISKVEPQTLYVADETACAMTPVHGCALLHGLAWVCLYSRDGLCAMTPVHGCALLHGIGTWLAEVGAFMFDLAEACVFTFG